MRHLKCSISLVQIQPDAVVRLQNRRIIAVVAVRNQEVEPTVLVPIHDFHGRATITRVKTEQHFCFELPLAFVGVQIDAFVGIGLEAQDVRQTVAGEIADMNGNRAVVGVECMPNEFPSFVFLFLGLLLLSFLCFLILSLLSFLVLSLLLLFAFL